MGAALLVLIGWHLDLEIFKGVVPGLTAMNPLTAVGFICAALSLLGHANGRRGQAAAFAWVCVAIGAVPLVCELTGAPWRPDAALYRASLDVYSPVNRMAPNTSICFIAVGLAILAALRDTGKSWIVSQICGCLAALLGLLTVVGYIANEISAAQVLDFIPMALNTGALFLVLGISITFLQPQNGMLEIFYNKSESARLARSLLLWSSFSVILINLLRLWGEFANLYSRPVSILIFSTVAVLCLAIVIAFGTRAYSKEERARREAEQENHRRAKFVREVVDAIPGFVYAKDREGRFVFANQATADAFDKPVEEVIGKRTLDFMPDSEELRTFLESDKRVIETGQPEDFEAKNTRPDGTVRWLYNNKKRLTSPESEEPVVFGIVTDMTELIEARQEAQRANEAKSEFISRMSHELRTPLNAVMGFAQLIQLHGSDPKALDSAEQIMKAGRHLLELINEVLDLARIEAGRLTVSLEPVIVEEAVQMALGIVRPIADARGVTIDSQGSSCDTVAMHADRQRLAQIIINLLSNAVKYNRREGRVSLRCGVKDGQVFIEVEDTGKGIPEDDRTKLFEPFERLGEGETEGTGLGLSLSRRLAGAMKGSLVLTASGPGGSTFRLELPQAEVVVAAKSPAPLVAAGIDSGKTGVTVLYIEDNLANLRLVEKVLEEWGPVRVVSAMQGSIGLEIVRSQRPNLVLLDLHLPDMSGLDVLREIRLDDRTAATPVVVLSADATSGQIKKTLATGADEYLTKPIDIVRLLRILSRWQAAGWKREPEGP